MRVIPLDCNASALAEATHKVVLTYADLLSFVALTATVGIFPVVGNADPATLIKDVKMRVVTPFAGVTTCTASVGDTGSATKFSAANDVKATANTVYGLQPATSPASVAASSPLNVYFTSTGTNLSTLSAGEVHMWFTAVPLQQY